MLTCYITSWLNYPFPPRRLNVFKSGMGCDDGVFALLKEKEVNPGSVNYALKTNKKFAAS